VVLRIVVQHACRKRRLNLFDLVCMHTMISSEDLNTQSEVVFTNLEEFDVRNRNNAPRRVMSYPAFLSANFLSYLIIMHNPRPRVFGHIGPRSHKKFISEHDHICLTEAKLSPFVKTNMSTFRFKSLNELDATEGTVSLVDRNFPSTF
jgi:hypothetical protein